MLRYNFHNNDVLYTSAAVTTKPDHWCQLKLLPGDPTVYDAKRATAVAPVLNTSNTLRNYNCVSFGISTNPNVAITDTQSVLSNLSDLNLSVPYSVTLGESLVITVGVVLNSAYFGAPVYDITGCSFVEYDPVTGFVLSTSVGTYIGGNVTGKLSVNGFKALRIVVSPSQYANIALSNAKAALVFTDATGNPIAWQNMSLMGLTPTNNYQYYTSLFGSCFAIDAYLTRAKLNLPILPLFLSFTPATNPISWQKPLPDTSVQTLNTASYTVGAITANTTLTTPFKFSNTSSGGYVITSIVATLKTATTLMSSTAKAKLATDFTLAVSQDGTAVGSLPVFTATSSTSTLNFTTPLQLTALDTLDLALMYSPTLKVSLSVANITPYPTLPATIATANATISAVNALRKVSIQVMGYQSGGSTVPVALGAPLVFSGSVA